MMRSPRPGCLSGTALLAAVLTLLIVGSVELARGNAMFSPGPLNARSGVPLGGAASHAEIGDQCARCHAAPWSREDMAVRCAACHTGLSAEYQDLNSLHGRILQSGAHCRVCHPDHRGPDAPLTEVGADFPHDGLDFSLRTHRARADGRPFTCADCHPAGFANGFDQNRCLDCHTQLDPAFQQAHLLDFGLDCLACHDGLDTYGGGFEHARTAFALEGKHLQIACRECHSGARSLEDLRAAPRECSACHLEDDAHAGRYGLDCGACHAAGGWTPATFDHALSAFPLTGAHVEAACESCHPDGRFAGTPFDCIGCHEKDDEHQGRYGADCVACHSTAAWKPAAFDHSRSAFQLTGAHSGVACERCHPNGRFRGTPLNCSGCHEDPAYHRGLFGATCDECHTVNAWSPAAFNRSHGFPIDHEGANACRDCHTTSLSAWTCAVCHPDSEIAGKHREEGINNFADCLRCHPTGQEGEGGGGGGGDD